MQGRGLQLLEQYVGRRCDFFLIFLQSSGLVFLGFLDLDNLLPPNPYSSIKVAVVGGGGADG